VKGQKAETVAAEWATCWGTEPYRVKAEQREGFGSVSLVSNVKINDAIGWRAESAYSSTAYARGLQLHISYSTCVGTFYKQ
jgi:hypothetical protein